MTQLPKETQKNGDTNQKGQINMQSTNQTNKHKLNMHKKTLGPTGLYELVLVAVHMENFQCTTSTALPSFSHDQHHKTDAAKRKGGASTDN